MDSPSAADRPARPAPAADTPSTDTRGRPAPWEAPPLAATGLPAVLLEAWRAADNRARCAPLAPADVEPAAATPRRARFAGGWGVAWDLPAQRSAFGVAGTGVSPDADTFDDWPHRIRWSDGSAAGWGPEGGTGPNLLAYLEVAGESCLYNVWSRLGPEHLQALLASLRRVER